MIRVEHGDSRDVLPTMAEASVDSVVTDPPYSLVSIQKRFGKPGQAPAAEGVYRRSAAGFMGKQWDTGETAFDPAFWSEVLRVLKPGAHLIAFGGTRTYHRLACAIEDAGFEIRDAIMWHYGSGFPKSHDVSKGIDKAAGASRDVVGQDSNFGRSRLTDGKIAFGDYAGEWNITAPATDAARQWSGWGTALKPATEILTLARKPLGEKTVAANVLAHGTGALNIDGCRVATEDTLKLGKTGLASEKFFTRGHIPEIEKHQSPLGRWPANLIHDGSDEVLAAFPETGTSSDRPRHNGEFKSVAKGHESSHTTFGHSDCGSAARFFYSAKADAGDRLQSKHPTVKPVDLMAYLCRLVTRPGGLVLDPFAGSGTTGMACMREGFDAILIEREAEYVADIRRRLAHVHGEDTPLFQAAE